MAHRLRLLEEQMKDDILDTFRKNRTMKYGTFNNLSKAR